MIVQIIDDGITIKLIRDDVVNNIPKAGTQVHVIGATVIVDPSSGLSEKIDYTEVTKPTFKSSEELRAYIMELLNNTVFAPIDEDSHELLKQILYQIKLINIHLTSLTGEYIK